jgi:OOP family OmpA-OmpF porin
MKFKLLAGAAMAAVCAASATGAAAQVGWYGAVDLGYHWPESLEATSSGNAANGIPYTWEFNQEKDWAGFARLGYQFTDHWRIELEAGYRTGDMDSIRGGSNQAITGLCAPGVTRSATAPGCGSPGGDLRSWTAMGNVLYDFAPDATFSPFLGVGLGVNHSSLRVNGQFSNVTGALTATNPAFQNLTIDDSDTAFAWQGIAGIAWKATDRLNARPDLPLPRWFGSRLRFGRLGSAATRRLLRRLPRPIGDDRPAVLLRGSAAAAAAAAAPAASPAPASPAAPASSAPAASGAGL